MNQTTALLFRLCLLLSFGVLYACLPSLREENTFATPASAETSPAAVHTQESATATPPSAPAPDKTPFPTESPPKTLFRENFEDDVTCFRLHAIQDGVTIGIEDGAYHIRVEGENGIDSRCHAGYDNFVLEFDLTLIEGDVHSLIGLMFRIYLGSSYNLYLTGDDDFCLDYFDQEQESYRNLAGCWGEVPEPLQVERTVRLKLVAAQEKMAVLIDDEVVAVVYDNAADYGTFGFFVINNGPGSTEIQIDNILIREITIGDTDVFRTDQTG